jgi:hypothetical protein
MTIITPISIRIVDMVLVDMVGLVLMSLLPCYLITRPRTVLDYDIITYIFIFILGMLFIMGILIILLMHQVIILDFIP